MKKIICIIFALTLFISAKIPTQAICAEETDYMAVMITAATEGDWEMGQEAQFARDLKISENNLDAMSISFEDLYLVAKIIYAEAGSNWLSDEWKMSVGEVVLNRVASSEFPNTVAEVLYQTGQYYGSDSPYFATLNPDLRCANIASKLLQGERVINNPAVVFQANFVQGGGVHTSFSDSQLGTTYFCYSNYAHIYEV